MTQLSIRDRLILLVATLAAGLIVATAFSIHQMAELNAQERATLARVKLAAQGADLGRSAQHHFKIQVQEWKNVLIRGGDPQAFDKYWNSFEAEEKLVLDRLARAGTTAEAMGVAARIPAADVAARLKKLGDAYRNAIRDYDRGRKDAAQVVDKAVAAWTAAPTRPSTRSARNSRQFSPRPRRKRWSTPMRMPPRRATWCWPSR
jgi:methyl-accepting chemotaxis protein